MIWWIQSVMWIVFAVTALWYNKPGEVIAVYITAANVCWACATLEKRA